MYPQGTTVVGTPVPVFGTGNGKVNKGEITGDVLFWSNALRCWVRLPPAANGLQLTTHGNGIAPSWEAPAPGSAPGIFMFGANSVGSTTTTRFLAPGNMDALAQTTLFEMEVGRAGTLRNMFVTQNVPGGDGDPIVYTVLVNGAPSALTVSMLSRRSSITNRTSSFST